jgi:hypothetical protein
MIRTVCITAVTGVLAASAGADTLNLAANHDNTIYSELTSNSNGAGSGIFVGANQQSNVRRGLVSFDLSSIPAGSTITGATLTMLMAQTVGGSIDVQLRRVTSSWGEGLSNGSGQGAAAMPGDATWLHRNFSSVLWSTPGGDFSPTVSATTRVGGVGSYSWIDPGMISDIQGWVNNPGSNNGWLLLGNEAVAGAAKRFGSRESGATGPMLSIQYTVPAPGAAVVLASAGLMVARRRRK